VATIGSADSPVVLAPDVRTALINIQDQFRTDFDWDCSDDLRSALRLQQACGSHASFISTSELAARTTQASSIRILGAAVEVDEVLSDIEDDCLLVAADGAVGVLRELPDSAREESWQRLLCVVSDADGDFPDLLEAAHRSIPFVLHAHGDNEVQWRALLDSFGHSGATPPLLLTHQTPERIDGMHNPGGFTDGGRAVCLLLSLGVSSSSIELVGFRDDIIGRWTGSTNPTRKMRKLAWMGRILRLAGVWQ